MFFFFKQKTAYEMRISDWSSDVCSSDLLLADRAVQGFVVAASDISALVEARTELRHLATHDELTGLPNRTNLRERLESVLADAGESGATLLFADVDGLTSVNDHHGPRAGDALLVEVAARPPPVPRPAHSAPRPRAPAVDWG